MTLAEQFKCEIPTPDALKDGVIYCSTNATNTPEIWSALGTWAGVAVTIAMAVLAWLAWQAARGQLREMQVSVRLQVLFELRGIHAEFDSEIAGNGKDTGEVERIRVIAEKLRAVEEKFKMIWEYPYGAVGISDFNTCLIGSIYAANDPEARGNGSVQDYRKLRSRGNLIFRDFYKSKKLDIAELDRNLVHCVGETVQSRPEAHSNLVAIYY